jgi:hypothetical protein
MGKVRKVGKMRKKIKKKELKRPKMKLFRRVNQGI